MSEAGEDWEDYRQAQKERRAKRLPLRSAEILALQEDGFQVKQLTEYQFRITHQTMGGVLDLYPTHNRYHDVRSGQRGGYRDAGQFVNGYFRRKNIGLV